MKIGFHVSVILCVLVVSSNSFGASICQRAATGFSLNQANINAIVSASCIALAHNESERQEVFAGEDVHFFHQWKIFSSEQGLKIKGYCSVPEAKLRSASDFFQRFGLVYGLGKYEIDLSVLEAVENSERKISFEGYLGGKDYSLSISEDLNERRSCGVDSGNFLKVGRIYLGGSLWDMVSSRRSNGILQLEPQNGESWVQGRLMTQVLSLGLSFRFSQAVSGRQVGISLVQGLKDNDIEARSKNLMGSALGGHELSIVSNSFGQALGFLDERSPKNHRFEINRISDGTQVKGCSRLSFQGELSAGLEQNFTSCLTRIENSVLKQFAEPILQTRRSLTPAEQAERKNAQELLSLRKKAQSYVSQMKPAARNYSDRPGVFEQGRVNWSHEDRERGFVVQQRSYSLDQQRKVMTVVEHRSDANGVKNTERIEIPFSAL